jgi:molybdopterin-guanine dinucleotide biosynthesis protein A
MTGIILAGGKASRMGGACNKAMLEVGGKKFIDRQLDVLRRVFSNVMIVTDKRELYKGYEDLIITTDIHEGKGPLGGIEAGLTASATLKNFVIACDMPFVDEQLIRYIMDQKDHDIVVPQIDGKFHPLLGMYSKDCLTVISEQIQQGDFRVHALFPKLRTRLLSKEDLSAFGLKVLTNINTPQEWDAANRSER